MGTIPRAIKFLLVTQFLSSFAVVGMVTIVGLAVFDLTGNELDLGLLGLAEFIPALLLAPASGSLSDRFDRRIVFACGLGIEAAVALSLFFYLRTEPTAVAPIFALIVVFGVGRMVASPSSRALPIDLAPDDVFERVVALRSVAFQAGGIVGPIALSVAFVVDPALPYLLASGLFIVSAVSLLAVSKPPTRKLVGRGAAQTVRDAFAGLAFIRRQPIVFGAISLDMCAVLFGGAVALLPAIAEERLGVGAVGLGWLRAAIGIGAGLGAIALSIRPLRRRVGHVLLMVVGVFGVATIVLGLTRSYAVAFAALMVLSVADEISVFIRASLVPLATPEEMRGRVLAVESVFIGASNQLGAVESGLTAAAFGLVGSVVLGGVGTLGVVALWWVLFPDLRRVDRFAEVRPDRFPT